MALPADVARPGYVRAGQRSGIVHLGIGAFHRAHQAVYTDAALAAGDRDWLITGVSLRSAQVRDALVPQDGLYTLAERANGTTRRRLIGSIATVLVAPETPDAAIAALADPATHIVTLTVTEKGYHRLPATGGLADADPAIAAELRGGAPTTTLGLIAAGLARRRADGAGGLTLLSCDNLSRNGRLLRGLMAEYLDARDPGLRAWAEDKVTYPDTMVDRIVPAVAPADLEGVAVALGLRDAAAITTEPFHQWVIEDRFAGPRPRWELGGAQFVQDVQPFETAKLRLLNGSHSLLAYAGLALGLEHVADAVAHSALGPLVQRMMRTESGPSIMPAPGLDIPAYCTALLDRFRNVDLRHRLEQIAADGSQKIAQRWLTTIIERADAGLDSPIHMLGVAAWIVHMRGHHGDGRPHAVSDPLADRCRLLWADGSHDVDRLTLRFVTDTGVFPAGFRDRPLLSTALAATLRRWLEKGPAAAIAEI
ncbi:MAG TPA: mannitol dehydrogenase family protein [Sphingomonas sp.]